MSHFASVNTLYKRKGVKVLPQNVARTDGAAPGGVVFWKDKILVGEKMRPRNRKPERLDQWLTLCFTESPVGTRISPDRLASTPVGEGLTEQEKELLHQCLMNREVGLAWEMSHMGIIIPEVTPLLKIDTVAHVPWHMPSFPVLKAPREEVNDVLRKRLRNGVLEPC